MHIYIHTHIHRVVVDASKVAPALQWLQTNKQKWIWMQQKMEERLNQHVQVSGVHQCLRIYV